MSTYEQFVLIGKNEGKIEGKTEADMRIAKRLLAKGFTFVQIADLMDLSIEEAKKLVEKFSKKKIYPKSKPPLTRNRRVKAFIL